MRKFLINALLLVTLLSICFPTSSVQAQAGNAYDLIAGVNALRQSLGLSPYSINGYLMDFAQSHSTYMASLGYWTHTRSDGTTAWDHGIQENVAMGTNMSIGYCIYTVWSDYVHWKTMVSYPGGSVGAGVAFDGNTVYYTLNVSPSSEIIDYNNPDPAPYQVDIPFAIQPVATTTPNEDGIMTHIVKYGETLWLIAIAYNVTMEEILINTGINPNTTDVFEGQKLIIKTAGPPTETPLPSETPILPTATITPPRPTRTPLPPRTPGPTSTPTKRPPILYRTFSDGQNVATVLITISGIGLILVLFFGFFKKPKDV